MPAELFFNWVWSQLADCSLVDAPGGAEYRRVLEDWENHGYPQLVVSFILKTANAPKTNAQNHSG